MRLPCGIKRKSRPRQTRSMQTGSGGDGGGGDVGGCHLPYPLSGFNVWLYPRYSLTNRRVFHVLEDADIGLAAVGAGPISLSKEGFEWDIRRNDAAAGRVVFGTWGTFLRLFSRRGPSVAEAEDKSWRRILVDLRADGDLDGVTYSTTTVLGLKLLSAPKLEPGSPVSDPHFLAGQVMALLRAFKAAGFTILEDLKAKSPAHDEVFGLQNRRNLLVGADGDDFRKKCALTVTTGHPGFTCRDLERMLRAMQGTPGLEGVQLCDAEGHSGFTWPYPVGWVPVPACGEGMVLEADPDLTMFGEETPTTHGLPWDKVYEGLTAAQKKQVLVPATQCGCGTRKRSRAAAASTDPDSHCPTCEQTLVASLRLFPRTTMPLGLVADVVVALQKARFEVTTDRFTVAGSGRVLLVKRGLDAKRGIANIPSSTSCRTPLDYVFECGDE